MNKFFRLTLSLVLMVTACLQAAAGDRPFYDSKSWIVNVAGDYQWLQNIGFASKVNGLKANVPSQLPEGTTKADCEEIAQKLTADGAGNIVINALTANGTDDAYLKRLALLNANKNDMELGSENLRADDDKGLSTLIQDDYEPILMNNYIVMTRVFPVKDSKGVQKVDRDGKPIFATAYAIYKVEVSKEEAFDIVANVGNPDGYAKLPRFQVKFMDFGVDRGSKTVTEISKNVPGLAVRGVLLRRNPARISIGDNAGLEKGDLVSIYSQRMTADGVPYSKRISRGRVCGVWGDEAQINFEAGTAGNRKNGDIVVRTPDDRQFFGVMATWMPHVWGGKITYDNLAGFTRAGIVHHILADVGFSMTDQPGTKFYVFDGVHNGYEYRSPMFINAAVGYGIGKTFLGWLDVTLFAKVQYEAGMMLDTSEFTDDSVDSNSKTILGSQIQVPVGLRLAFNVAYPVRIVLEGGYMPRFGFGDDYKIVKQACEYTGARRSGGFISLGVSF